MQKFLTLIILITMLIPSALTIANPAEQTPGACPGFDSRFTVGDVARITPGPPNNLRSEPSSSSDRIGGIAGGDPVVLLEGPVCADGVTWWRVNYADSFTGWTGEGIVGQYWMEPIPPEERLLPVETPTATDGRVPEELLRGLAFSVGVGGEMELCAPFLGSQAAETPTEIMAGSRVDSTAVRPIENNGSVTVDQLPVNIESHLAWRMPAICVPDSVSVITAAAISPNNERLEPGMIELEGGEQYHLPLSAYTQPGTWQLLVNDWQIDVEIAITEPGFLYDPTANELLFVGFDPGENFLVIGGGAFDQPANYFEAEADENGHLLTTYEDHAAVIQQAALVGQNGHVRSSGFRVGALDSITDYVIPGEYVGSLLHQALWANATIDFHEWTCPDAAAIRLQISEAARIVGTDQVVRITPDSDAESITTLPMDSIVTMADGVYCGDESVWWGIDLGADFGFRRGFILESRGGDYLIEPLDTPNIDAVAATEPAESEPTQSDCVVTALQNARLRTGPGTEYEASLRGLAGGQNSRADAQALDSEDMIWYRLVSGDWVREDVVHAIVACASLPQVQP